MPKFLITLDQIAELWESGCGIRGIAVRAGCSANSIWTLAIRRQAAGDRRFDPRPRTKPARINLDELAAVWATGEPLDEIAERMAVSVSCIKYFINRARAEGDKRFPSRRRGGGAPCMATRPKKSLHDRSCLKCRRMFPSRGPHNRICRPCRDSKEMDHPCPLDEARVSSGHRARRHVY